MAVKERAYRPVQPVQYDAYGLNFSQADSSREQALRAMEDAYRSGGDWISGANALGANGDFVSVGNEGGAPTGAYRSISGETNGSMLWGLNGQMANTGVSEGTRLIAPDGSYWQVGADNALTPWENPYQAAIAAADGGNGAVRPSGGAVPGSGGVPETGGYSAAHASSGRKGNPYAAYLDAFDYGPAPEWGGSEYERRRDEALQRAENMQFNYDPNTDPSWQAYQKQYRREGQRAAADALGQAAALTGGVPSSYAVTAASQAGDYYAARLSDKLPQLYRDAYDRYLQEYQRQLGIADAYAGYGRTEYDRYLDRLGQYDKDRSFAYGQYRDAVGDQRYADERDYSRSRDTLGDERYDAEWEYRQAQDAYDRAQDALDREYRNRQYEDSRRDAAVDEALAIAKYLGYVPEQYAELLGVPAGTQYYTLANASTGSGRSSGGSSSSGASALAKKFASMGSAQILAYIKKNFGEGILSDGDWQKLTEAGLDPDWLYQNGFRTQAQQAVINNDSLTDYETLLADAAQQGGSYEPGNAAVSPLRETAEGDMTHRSGAIPEGVRHENGSPMTDGFRQLWPQLRRDFDRGADRESILRRVREAVENGTIADYEKDVIIRKLGL